MNICVFCSSCDAIADSYKQQAARLGEWIVQNGHTLVYGGATGGLMDAVAQGAHRLGGEILGIVPQSIVDKGRKSPLNTELLIVADMDERKALLKENADVFVVLPGGIGTLDEMFDAIASRAVGEHNKPLVVFNPDNYWEGLITQIRRMEQERTAHKISVDDIPFAADIDRLLLLLQNME